MKTPSEWIAEIAEAGSDHVCACICERCKEGRETFLLPADIEKIQKDACAGMNPEAVPEMIESIETLLHIISQQAHTTDTLFDAGIAKARTTLLKAKLPT